MLWSKECLAGMQVLGEPRNQTWHHGLEVDEREGQLGNAEDLVSPYFVGPKVVLHERAACSFTHTRVCVEGSA